MSEEFRYASAAGDSHKRKYDDSPSPVARRGTGFSMAPDAAAPPPSYGSVPPPMNEIELAKQKAQEIAARLLNNADPTKRARVENGGGGGGGFDSSDYGGPKTFGLGHSNPPPMASSGYPGSKKIEIPNGRVGVIIGKGGETIKYLQQQSGAKIQVTRDTDSDPNSTTRGVELMGTPDQISRAEQLIADVLAEAEAGSSGGGARRISGQPGAEQFVMKVPNNKVGLVIGKGGETIKSMQANTGARIQVIPLHLPPGDTSNERTVQIDGTSEQIEAAKQLVEEVISENRMRNSSMSGGYRQQGYQARPPTNWGQPPPMQQPGYGYTQPGPYPGQAPQYPMNQPPYPGYPPQPASAGYPTGWDQSSAPANPQGAQGGTTYDYYNQQQPPQQQQPPHGNQGVPDASGYNYGQAPQYSYSQDGYGYHAGYGQPPSNPASGYDQQQQGYNSAYGSSAPTSNPPTDANNPPSYGAAQGEANQGPGYGGVPPPSSQGGYGTTAGYGNYGQKPQQSPQSGYPAAAAAAAGYGGQSYPGGYGQQQYGGYYGSGGGGYSQQGSDGSAAAGGGSGSGAYEGGAVQAAAETSPPS